MKAGVIDFTTWSSFLISSRGFRASWDAFSFRLASCWSWWHALQKHRWPAWLLSLEIPLTRRIRHLWALNHESMKWVSACVQDCDWKSEYSLDKATTNRTPCILLSGRVRCDVVRYCMTILPNTDCVRQWHRSVILRGTSTHNKQQKQLVTVIRVQEVYRVLGQGDIRFLFC